MKDIGDKDVHIITSLAPKKKKSKLQKKTLEKKREGRGIR